VLRYLLGTLDLLPRLDLEGQPVRNAGQYISLSPVDTLVGRANFNSLSLALLGLRLIIGLHAIVRMPLTPCQRSRGSAVLESLTCLRGWGFLL